MEQSEINLIVRQAINVLVKSCKNCKYFDKSVGLCSAIKKNGEILTGIARKNMTMTNQGRDCKKYKKKTGMLTL